MSEDLNLQVLDVIISEGVTVNPEEQLELLLEIEEGKNISSYEATPVSRNALYSSLVDKGYVRPREGEVCATERGEDFFEELAQLGKEDVTELQGVVSSYMELKEEMRGESVPASELIEEYDDRDSDQIPEAESDWYH